MNFLTKFPQERYLWSKTEKVNMIIEFPMFKLFLMPNFRLNWKFWTRFAKKGFFWTRHNFYIILLHIQISLVWNFSSNWQFWFFGPNLPKKVFPVKNRKSEHHHGILHIHISLVQNLKSNWQFWFFGPNLPKKLLPVKNWKSEHHHWIPYVQIRLGTKFPLNWQFWFFDQICPKRVFLV